MEKKKSKKAELESKRPMFFLIGLTITLTIVFYAFEWKSAVNKADELEGITVAPPDEEMIPIIREEKQQKAEPPKEVVLFDIVDDETEIDIDLEIIDAEIDSETAIDFEKYMTKEKEVEEDIPAVWFADEMPEFPGGMKSLLKFINTNVKYPLVAQEAGIHGKVYVTFVIDKTGEVTNVRLLRGVDPSLDAEALRVVRQLPKWKPGKQNGRTVKVNYNVPINFILQ